MFKRLGFSWRTDVALPSSLAAWEVFVSTLGQMVVATNSNEPFEELSTMTDDRRNREFTAPAVIALLAYFMFVLQCMSTIGVMRRGIHSW
ncbi:hypothetical protein MLPM_0472 [Mycobacterium lepromatosis]|uniref:Uncharacterized protein n=1 Tax=Mycobacterium lepromatosis TaxID=480418 RepID=A0A0F4ERW3_9MYCO|nr:hypothetical protein MLPM_0472 [Mycobacterium lepromatosis]